MVKIMAHPDPRIHHSDLRLESDGRSLKYRMPMSR